MRQDHDIGRTCGDAWGLCKNTSFEICASVSHYLPRNQGVGCMGVSLVLSGRCNITHVETSGLQGKLPYECRFPAAYSASFPLIGLLLVCRTNTSSTALELL